MSSIVFTESRGEETYEVTQKVEEVDVYAAVAPLLAERRKWVKYGLEKNSPAGPQKTTTDVEENEVTLRLFPKTARPNNNEKQEVVKKQSVMSNIVCRRCRGDHFTHACPFKDQIAMPADQKMETEQPENTGKYVPPTRGKLGAPNARSADEEAKTLKVSNLPQDIDERMLKDAFSRVGKLTRCHIAREKDTGMCRGFAFVSYDTKEEAEKAKNALDGKAIRHLVIQVEFSKKKPQ